MMYDITIIPWLILGVGSGIIIVLLYIFRINDKIPVDTLIVEISMVIIITTLMGPFALILLGAFLVIMFDEINKK